MTVLGERNAAPLDGVNVLEWSVWQAASVAGLILQDLGAHIVKLEDLLRGGDSGRHLSHIAGHGDVRHGNSWNSYFEVANRGKQSIALNLREESGREVLRRLVARSDVFLVNVRPASIRRAQAEYSDLVKVNQRLVFGQITGYGSRGPLADRAGADYTAQARAGMLRAGSADDSTPTYVPGIADMMAGNLLATAVCASLAEVANRDVGRKVEVSVFGSAMWLQYTSVGLHGIAGIRREPVPRTNPHDPLWNHYRCADGQWIAMASLRGDAWERFCDVAGIDEDFRSKFAATESRVAAAEYLVTYLDQIFASRDAKEWLHLLGKDESLLFDLVQDVWELAEDPQVDAMGYFTKSEHPRYGAIRSFPTPITTEGRASASSIAPELGNDTVRLLTECGYTKTEIAAFVRDGVAGGDNVPTAKIEAL